MRKQTLGLAVLSVVVILASWLIGNHLPAPARTQAQTTGGLVILKPYTLKATLYRQGQIIDNITAAVRSDGSYVMNRRFFPGNDPNQYYRRLRFSDGRNVKVADSLGMVWFDQSQTPPASAQRLLNRANPYSTCISANNQTFKRWGRVLGERVAVITDDPEATKPFLITLEKAPGLGCEILAYHVEDPDGNITIEQKPESLVYEEPDAALFEIPSNFQVVKPSVALAAAHQCAGIVPSAIILKRWADYDAHCAKGQQVR